MGAALPRPSANSPQLHTVQYITAITGTTVAGKITLNKHSELVLLAMCYLTYFLKS